MPPNFNRVKKEGEFIIPFKGLNPGQHRFTFKIDDKFFESFEYFDNERGTLEIEVNIIREAALIDLQFLISGGVNLICDRCLGNYQQPVSGEFRLIVKFGKIYLEESDDVVILPVAQTSLDIKQYIFEYINLILPVKRVHLNPGDCDREMIKKLKKYSKPEHDPRWDVLKTLKMNK